MHDVAEPGRVDRPERHVAEQLLVQLVRLDHPHRQVEAGVGDQGAGIGIRRRRRRAARRSPPEPRRAARSSARSPPREPRRACRDTRGRSADAPACAAAAPNHPITSYPRIPAASSSAARSDGEPRRPDHGHPCRAPFLEMHRHPCPEGQTSQAPMTDGSRGPRATWSPAPSSSTRAGSAAPRSGASSASAMSRRRHQAERQRRSARPAAGRQHRGAPGRA